MTGNSHPQLDASDRDALAHLVTEAAWRVDHQQASSLHELFADDAAMALGTTTAVGRSEIAAWGAERDTRETVTRHVVTNFRFVATGPNAASGTTVMTVFMHSGTGSPIPEVFAVGDYHDEFAKIDGTWRFTSRRVELAFPPSA